MSAPGTEAEGAKGRASQWADLGTRVGSAVGMAVIGGAAIWFGGMALGWLVVVLGGLMAWEVTRLQVPTRPAPEFMGLLAAAVLAAIIFRHDPRLLPTLGLPSLVLLFMGGRDRLLRAVYLGVVLLAAYAFYAFREGYGLAFTLWLVLLVIACDVMGYFGGRLIGGPKFWPAVSPKKTWSGTIAGWIGAGAVGAVFAAAYDEPSTVTILSVLAAFAAQMGDIAESAIKRRAGAKDSSALIPGHGGLLDRFDALIGAAVFVIVWGLCRLPLPNFGG